MTLNQFIEKKVNLDRRYRPEEVIDLITSAWRQGRVEALCRAADEARQLVIDGPDNWPSPDGDSNEGG